MLPSVRAYIQKSFPRSLVPPFLVRRCLYVASAVRGMAFHRRFTARSFLSTLALLLLVCFYLRPIPPENAEHDQRPPVISQDSDTQDSSSDTGDVKQAVNRRTAVVVASRAGEDTTWLDDYFPEWEKNIYRVDNEYAKLTVPKNKGRESMVYLTWVVELRTRPSRRLLIHA